MANNEKELNQQEATDALSAAMTKKLREIEAKTGEPLKGIEIKPGCRYLLVIDEKSVPMETAVMCMDDARLSHVFHNVHVWYGDPDALRLFEFKE